MTSFLDRALGAVQLHLDSSSPAARIERVVARKDGGLTLFAEGPAGPRWFQYHDDGVAECFPFDDQSIPLLSEMQEVRRGEVEVLAWRPGRRVALLDKSGSKPTILKGFRSKRGYQSGVDLERLVAVQAACDGMIFPRCLDLLPELRAYRMKLLPGEPLRILREHAPVFSKLGANLAIMQEKTSCAGLLFHGYHDELKVLSTMERRTQRLTPTHPDWRPVFERIGVAGNELPVGPTAFLHRDLHDGQLLFDGHSLAILDFDLMCVGDPLLDVANLAAHLQLRVMQDSGAVNQDDADACREALVGQFVNPSDVPGQRRLQFYSATTYLRLAVVYSVRPRWRQLVPTLIQHARECCAASCEV